MYVLMFWIAISTYMNQKIHLSELKDDYSFKTMSIRASKSLKAQIPSDTFSLSFD